MNQEFILDENSLDTLFEYFSKKVQNGDFIVLLRGDLASGKTTFVKKYLRFLGLEDIVTSPTFSLQAIYSNNIFHYDIYNKTLEEFLALGMLEEFEKSGLHFVEWGDENLENLLIDYGFNPIVIEIKKLGNKRKYKLYA